MGLRDYHYVYGNYKASLHKNTEYRNSYIYKQCIQDCPSTKNLSSFTTIKTKLQSAIQASEAAFRIQIFTGLVLPVCALASSILPCRPLCCPPRKTSGAQNSLKFSLGEVSRVDLVTLGKESGKVEEAGHYHQL